MGELIHDLQRLWNPQHYCSLKSFYLVANQQTIYHATLSVYKLKLLVQELEKMFQKNVTAKEGTEHHVQRAGDGKTKKKRRARVHTHTHAYTRTYERVRKYHLFYSSLVRSARFPQALLTALTIRYRWTTSDTQPAGGPSFSSSWALVVINYGLFSLTGDRI